MYAARSSSNSQYSLPSSSVRTLGARSRCLSGMCCSNMFAGSMMWSSTLIRIRSSTFMTGPPLIGPFRRLFAEQHLTVPSRLDASRSREQWQQSRPGSGHAELLVQDPKLGVRVALDVAPGVEDHRRPFASVV